MRIHRKLLIAAASTLVAAGTIVSTGVLIASAAPRAATTEHFQLVNASATSNKADVILWGPVTAHAVDIQGNTSDLLKLSNGTFVVSHSVPKGPQTFNAKTCLFTANQTGTYSIGHGTGAYKGISGSGKYAALVIGIGAKSKGACSQKLAPLGFHLIITATGPVHL